MKFSKRYFFLPVALIVFFILFYLVYNDIKSKTVNEYKKEQLMLAQSSSQGITTFFQNYKNEMTFISSLKYIIDFNDESKEFMKSYYENHKNFIEAITRVDDKGRILYTYPFNESVIGNDISYQEHVNKIISTHQPVISDVFMSVQGYLAVALHVPVFKESKYVGSLAVLIQIDKIGKQYLGNINIRGEGNAWIITENSIEIFCPLEGHKGKSFLAITGNDSLAVKLLDNIKNETQGTVRSVHQEVVINGNKRLVEKYMAFYRVPLENTYWTILISFQEKEVYAELASFRNRLVLIFAFVFIVMAYYFYSLTKVRTVFKEEAKRKEAEKILLESEERFRTLVESLNDGIIQSDENDVIQFVNNSIIEMFGYTQTELIGKKACEIIIFDEDKDIVLGKLQLRKKGVSERYEVRGIKKSGEIIWLSINGTPIFDNKDKVIYSVGVLSNITNRKRAEEEVLKISHAINQSPVTIIITNLKGEIEFVNPKFVELTGYLPEEVLGKNPKILKSGEKSSEEYKNLWDTINGGNDWFGEFHNKKKNGELFWERAIISPVKNSEGKITHFLAVKEDITERKYFINELVEAKDKAEEMSILKSSFLANMSHEIRTPLNGILGFAELLKDELKDDELKDYVKVIEKGGKRLLETLDLILNFSKLEAEMMTAHFSEVNVENVINEVVNNFEAMAKNKNLFIKKEIIHKNLSSRIDERFLRQLLNNLVKNAIVYTDKGGITVRLDKVENELIIKVIDTGIGIDKKNYETIFEPFRQESEGIGRSFEGTGLGLSITKKFVEMMKGKIEVESEVGVGSAFTVRFPLLEDAEITHTESNKEESAVEKNDIVPIKKKDLKILLVENDLANLQYTASVLGKHYKTDTAMEGYDSINKAKNNSYDIILMDINLGKGIDGIMAIKEIRKLEAYKNTPIVALTAYVREEDKEEFLAGGCTHYLGKPFSAKQLLDLIESI